jgi:hypothetical protein
MNDKFELVERPSQLQKSVQPGGTRARYDHQIGIADPVAPSGAHT